MDDELHRDINVLAPAERIASHPEIWDDLDEADFNLILETDWSLFARPEQRTPPGGWYIWLILAGRGWGKTRTGAEWMAERSAEQSATGQPFRGALVGPTNSDARETMVEGESGLLSVLPPSRLVGGSVDNSWRRTFGELRLADGSYFKIASAEKPDRLRGPQWHAAWCDELSSWRDAGFGLNDRTNSTFGNLRYGVRLGQNPQIVITTTPKPNKLTRELAAVDTAEAMSIVVTRRSTFDNVQNLAPAFIDQVIEPTRGTRLGRQELYAEILEDIGEMFDISWIEMVDAPLMGRVWRARYWDLAATEPSDSNRDPDWTVGTLAALDTRTRMWRVEDMERFRLRPGARNERIAKIALRDTRVYGKNQLRYYIEQEPGSGGVAQLEELQRHLEGVVAVHGYRPTGDKRTRSEAVAAAMEQHRVQFVQDKWNGPILNELSHFPSPGVHDDTVDTLSGLWAVAPGRYRRTAIPTGESQPRDSVESHVRRSVPVPM